MVKFTVFRFLLKDMISIVEWLNLSLVICLLLATAVMLFIILIVDTHWLCVCVRYAASVKE